KRGVEGGHAGLGIQKRAWAGKRQMHDALDLALDDATARQRAQHLVKLGVEGDIGVEVHRLRRDGDDLVKFPDKSLESSELCWGYSAFGGKPGGGAFKHTAQFDRVYHVGLGEEPHRIAAGGDSIENAFLLEPGKSGAHGGTRQAEPFADADFGQPFAGRDRAREDKVAHAENRFERLGRTLFLARFPGHGIILSYNIGRVLSTSPQAPSRQYVLYTTGCQVDGACACSVLASLRPSQICRFSEETS